MVEDVIEDVYGISFKEFRKTGEQTAFKLLHHIAEFDNTEMYNRKMRDERRQRLRNY